MIEVNIEGLDKAKLLMALFNNSFQQGMGVMHKEGAVPMNLEDAKNLVAKNTYYDYLRGRIMKVDIKGPMMFTAAYNRDVGHGEAERIVAQLRAEG